MTTNSVRRADGPLDEITPTSGRRRIEIAWAIFFLIVGLYAAGLWFGWQTRSHPGLSGWGAGGLAVALAFVASTFVFPLVGLLVATRRPGNAIAWLLLAIGAVWGLDSLLSTYAVYGLDQHQGSHHIALRAAAIDGFLWLVAIGLLTTFLILYFPNGHLPSPRWRIVTWTSGVIITLGSISILFTPGPMTQGSFSTPATNPYGVSNLAATLNWAGDALVVLPLMFLASAASLIVRYRRALDIERAQTKWIAAATIVVAGVSATVFTMSLIVSNPEPTWLRVLEDLPLFSFALIPASIGVAVLRYHLYDIDVIIRKTLVYGALLVALGLLYLAGVVALGWLFRHLTGQSGSVAVTFSTLAVAIAFQPLRTRISSKR